MKPLFRTSILNMKTYNDLYKKPVIYGSLITSGGLYSNIKKTST